MIFPDPDPIPADPFADVAERLKAELDRRLERLRGSEPVEVIFAVVVCEVTGDPERTAPNRETLFNDVVGNELH